MEEEAVTDLPLTQTNPVELSIFIHMQCFMIMPRGGGGDLLKVLHGLHATPRLPTEEEGLGVWVGKGVQGCGEGVGRGC